MKCKRVGEHKLSKHDIPIEYVNILYLKPGKPVVCWGWQT